MAKKATKKTAKQVAKKSSKKITYASSGVDVAKVKGIQNKINNLIFTTSNKYSIALKGHYAGLFRAGGATLAIHADGVGTKVLVAQAVGKYDTVGIDAVAMNTNDMICVGAEPIVCVDYLAMNKADEKLSLDIMKGLVRGSKESGCALIGGETAILPDIIVGGKKPFDLAVTCVGLIQKGTPDLTGKRLKSGDVIVGLASSGIHSNGYSLARKLLPIKKWGKQMLTPTRVYVKPVLEMIKRCEIHGIAHITGGAYSKLMRVGKYAKKGFLLDNMPSPSPIFQAMASKVNDDREMYRTFNMGIGMCIMCPNKDAAKVLAIARKYKIPAQLVGKVTDKEDVILENGKAKISLL